MLTSFIDACVSHQTQCLDSIRSEINHYRNLLLVLFVLTFHCFKICKITWLFGWKFTFHRMRTLQWYLFAWFAAVNIIWSAHITPSMSINKTVIIKSKWRHTQSTLYGRSHIYLPYFNAVDVVFICPRFKFIFMDDSIWCLQNQSPNAPFQWHLLKNV